MKQEKNNLWCRNPNKSMSESTRFSLTVQNENNLRVDKSVKLELVKYHYDTSTSDQQMHQHFVLQTVYQFIRYNL